MNTCYIADPVAWREAASLRPLASFCLTALLVTWAICAAQLSAATKPADVLPNECGKVEELAKRSVPDLVRMLQLGSSSQKSQAAHALGRKAFNGDASAAEAVPELILSLRSLSGGRLADDAAEALARIGAPAVEPLKAEVSGAARQCTQSGRLYAARALGLMGVQAKASAAPTLAAILENPRRSAVAKDPLIPEAALALASMGGPYKPSLLPDIVAAMCACGSFDRQVAIAVQIADTCDATSRYSESLVRVLGKAAVTPGIPLAQRQEALDALVKLNTSASLQVVLLALMPPQKNLSYGERAAAASALAKLQQPSPYVLGALVRALQAERSGGVISPICRALATYGAQARPALPALESYLKELPQRKGLDGGDNEKPALTRALTSAIGKISCPSGGIAQVSAPLPDAFRRLGLRDQIAYAMSALTNASAARLSAAGYEAALISGFNDPAYEGHRKSDLLAALARLNTPASTRHVCDVLLSPNTYRDSKTREAAALALLNCKPPSPDVVGALQESILNETSAGVVMLSLRTLKSYGPAAASALPALERYRQELPAYKRFDSGEREKPWVTCILEETITSLRPHVASAQR
jgi:hypothetical protein